MFPMVMLGAIIGVQINVLLPDAIVLILLTLILLLLSVKSVLTAINARKKENKVLDEERNESKANLNREPRKNKIFSKLI